MVASETVVGGRAHEYHYPSVCVARSRSGSGIHRGYGCLCVTHMEWECRAGLNYIVQTELTNHSQACMVQVTMWGVVEV